MLAALVPVLALRGFTVDDALITARVAHHLATGVGYRFNPHGPVVDAVTPLGFAYLLAPFARSGPLAALAAAKVLGIAVWLAAVVFLAHELASRERRGLAVGLLALLVTVPLAAWAAAGMETALVTALATFALAPPPFAACAAGLLAGLRPELGPWAFSFMLTRALFEPLLDSRRRALRLARDLGLVLAPLLAVAFVRTALFGHAYPLSVVAKPSDLAHGARYALGALAFSGPPLLLLTGVRAYTLASARTRASLVALAVHVVALTLAGGDWMPFYRLFVPVLPSVILASAELADASRSRVALGLRIFGLLVVTASVAFVLGPSARRVETQRASLIEAARPLLAGAERVAALDVGWVGAATSADIVDLAGVTDESMARLSGGHTTKRLPEGLLELRRVDAIVLLAEHPERDTFPNLRFARGVEAQIPTLAGIEQFRSAGSLPLSGTDQAYVVLRR